MKEYLKKMPVFNFNPVKICIISVLTCMLWACETDTPKPELSLDSPKIDLSNPLFVAEDSCRLVPLPPSGGSGAGYNDFPDAYLTKTIAHNPDNPCEYISHITATDPLNQFYLLVNLCTQTAEPYTHFPPGTRAWPVWGPNEWFLLSVRGEVWKMKSNGDSLQLIIPNTSIDQYYNISWDPLNKNWFYFAQKTAKYKADLEGNFLDTLGRWYNVSSDRTKGLGYIQGESIGYYDIATGEYNPVSTKYKYNLSGAWHPDSEHIVWLVVPDRDVKATALVMLNINSGEERIIKSHQCFNRTYANPKVTQDGKWVYMRLIYAEHLGGKDLFTDWFTAFVNIETGEEYWGAFEPQ